MQETHSIPATELVRIPGLYRRWELAEVVKIHHAFRIEDAGVHQDGTPLLAIYAASDGSPQTAATDVPDARGGPMSRGSEKISRRR